MINVNVNKLKCRIKKSIFKLNVFNMTLKNERN